MPIELLVFWRFQGRISNGTPVSLRDVPPPRNVGTALQHVTPPPKSTYSITHHRPSTGFTYCGRRWIMQGCQNPGHKVAPGNKFSMLAPKYFWVLSIALA
jgi:hypothetical protein